MGINSWGAAEMGHRWTTHLRGGGSVGNGRAVDSDEAEKAPGTSVTLQAT
jgi:hypothetical protein